MRSSRAVLTPQAYVYLRRPRLSSGETMLYHTIQHLCFTGSLRVHFAEVEVGVRQKRKLNRLFITRGQRPAETSLSELFAWEILTTDLPHSLVHLQTAIADKVSDYELFKYDLLRPELNAAGLLKGRHKLTTSGRDALRRTRDLLYTVEQDIGRSLQGGWERSIKHVHDLGSCITLLDDDTHEQLKKRSSRPSDLIAVFSILNYLERFTAGGNDGGMFGGSGGGFGGGGGFSGGGGFGGGSFGGGGAGGSW